MTKPPITGLTPKALQSYLTDHEEAPYRAKQILDWLYRKPITSFDAMSNLPPKLRQLLEDEFIFQSIQPVTKKTSRDRNTQKVLFRLHDGHTIESVLMHYHKRRTVCVSSQVGCAFGCPLCVTGTGGFERNLTPAEIIDQVLHFSRMLRAKNEAVTNVVFMGMGEPLTNFEAVWRAIETFTSDGLLNIGARHITISTSGITPGIKKLGRKKLQVGLAVSLHAPNDALRDTLVPPNKMYPLHTLIPECQQYVEATNRRITFEYALIKDVNDSPQQAVELGNLLRGTNCYVNLIPVNPSANPEFKPPARARVQVFSETLSRHHVANTVRLARGLDIEAGCGQLRVRLMEAQS